MSGCRVAEDMFAVSQSDDHSPGWGRVTLKSVGMDVDMDVDMDMDTNSIQTESPNTDFYETLNVSRTVITSAALHSTPLHETDLFPRRPRQLKLKMHTIDSVSSFIPTSSLIRR